MGSIYRQKGRPNYMIKYWRDGRAIPEATGSSDYKVAQGILREREGDLQKGAPLSAKVNRVRFEEAAQDVVTDYRINRKRSIDDLERRLDKHLVPFFTGRRLASITTSDIRKYIAHRLKETKVVTRTYPVTMKDGRVQHIPARIRKTAGPSNGQLNRELTTLKRIFTLAVQDGKLLRKPHVPLLAEDNVRTGFFEAEQFESMVKHLPEDIRPVMRFAYITGWRLANEVLPLEWRNVDFASGEIRLDSGKTKNKDGRVFIMTDDLRALLRGLQEANLLLKRQGHIVAKVFVRMVAKGRGGDKEPRPILSCNKAFAKACRASGQPGRIPHDLRRTAVRNMVRRGVSERVAMRLTGHKTRSVFERYNIVSDGDLAQAAVQLSGLLPGTGSSRTGTR